MGAFLKVMAFRRVPRIMAEGKIRLRPFRILDAPFLTEGFRREGIHPGFGLQVPSWLAVWWWTRKTFLPAYCIEYDSRPIGFAGLYNLLPGESAEISMAIFEKAMRGRGCGTRSLSILVRELRRHSLVKRLYVRVREDNRVAMRFWRKMGFVEVERGGGIVRMSLDLRNAPEGDHRHPGWSPHVKGNEDL